MGDFYLGIDVGTTNVKAGLFDGDLRPVAEARAEYKTSFPRGGWAEQNAEDWWESTRIALRRLVTSCDVPATSIKGLCVSSQAPSVAAVDERGVPLRPALIWMDRRSEPECDRIRRQIGESRVSRITGNRVDPYFAVGKLLWLKDAEPSVLARTRWILQANGYINFRLTGVASIDQVHASLFGLYDVRRRAWSRDLCRKLGVEMALLPPIHPPAAIVGRVTEAAAEKTGLAAGTPVCAGNVDASAAALEAGVLGKGDALEATGTSTVLMIGCDTIPTSSHLVSMGHAFSDHALLIGPISSTGAALKWYRDTLGQDECSTALNGKTDPYAVMSQEAEAVDPGALIFLPYLSGERAPIWDSDARGVFFGLHMQTSKGCLIRSIMEGAAFALRHNIEEASSDGFPIAELKSVGGGAESRFWLQIKASVLGIPIVTYKNASSGILGDAALAATGEGETEKLARILRSHLIRGERFEPDPRAHARYDKLYRIYRNIYAHTKGDFKDLAAI